MTGGHEKHRVRSIVVMSVVAATGGFLYGFDTVVIAGALGQIKEMWALSSFAEGTLTSAILAGGMAGSLVGGGLVDRLGRRSIMMGTAASFVVGAFWCGLAKSLWVLVVGRVLLGTAVGVVTVAVPLYIAEIAPPKFRGALVSMQQFFLVGGVVSAYLIGAAFASKPEGWRSMFMAGALPGVLLGVGMLFMPESPRWLLSRGRVGSARRMLRRLGSEDVDGELATMREGLNAMRDTDTSVATWSDLREPWLRPAMIIGIALIFFQQMTGITMVEYYSPTIFSLAGYEASSSAMFLTVGVGVINFIMTALAMLLVDRFGRRPLFGGGLIVMVTALSGLGLSIHHAVDNAAMKWVVVGSVFVFIAAFALSLGAVTGAVIAEIYPQRLRGLAMSIVIVFGWVFQIVVAATFPFLLSTLGASLTFFGYAAIGVSGLMFWLFYLPETKGRSLEEIEAFWRSGQPPRKLR